KDPIHGYLRISPEELTLIDSFPLQRLRRIKQLPGSDYVYPGAVNTRFEHSLGVMHLAGMMGESLRGERETIELLRLAGLLHDIGHGPFSHSFENILMESFGISHEEMTSVVIRKTEISDLLGRMGFHPSDVVELIRGMHHERSLSKVINSSIDSDKMDYIVRDSYHTGAGYSVDIHRIASNAVESNGDLAINIRALEAIESLFMARLLSYRTIYYHKTSRGVQLMLEMGMRSILDRLGLDGIRSDPNPFLELDDYRVWELLRSDVRSKWIVERLTRRDLLKVAWEKHGISLIKEKIDEVKMRIAELTGVKESDVIVDAPIIEFASGDLPKVLREGESIELSEASPVLKRLLGANPSFVRIYTWPELRNRLREELRDIPEEEVIGD
ncbi:MAG: HD domain-containing protein, partial [Candidatus Korarchaeum sp.]|nr:HD domain-containing protein [Candidatus Korarchaeum sp.]MDW8034891.1 HD domain-containing protein [Candidatus Korarchaeum sp.]